MQVFSELQSGTGLCGGKYIIEKKIGEGGFGITYRAIQTGLNRVVCIKEYFLAGRCVRDVQAKTIHLQGAGEDMYEKYRAAFVKEAQTLAALHHPGIVEVIDIFDENNTSYMVMPFVEGRSLQSIVEKNGPLAYPEAVNYIAQVANAVGYIHQHHILHRDIKPDNIMVTADYKAVLIDFGSAREFEEDKTQAHTSMLTHGYAPTEQYTRNSRKGAYTDIYALGATLYFILTGQVPMEAAARFTETMPEPKELVPNLPEEANRTIMKAMQLKSQDRHQSIDEFMNDLRNVVPSSDVQKKKETVNSNTIKGSAPQKKEKKTETQKSKKSLVWVGIAAAILAILVGLGITANSIVKNKEDKDRIAKLVVLYEEKTKSCELFINSIVQDRDGNQGNKHFIIEALMTLKEIENMESDANFDKMGITPKYKELFNEYKQNLKEAELLVNNKYERQVELGLTDNNYCVELKERLDIIRNILKQAENGSAVAINLKPVTESQIL